MKTKDLLSYSDPSANELEPIIDLQPILDECMDEIDLLKELIVLYDRNALEFIGAAKIHLRMTDFTLLESAAHKIKAGLAMMRSDSLHAIIELIQKECKGDQDKKHLQFLCDCFATEYPMVKKAIDKAFANLNKG